MGRYSLLMSKSEGDVFITMDSPSVLKMGSSGISYQAELPDCVQAACGLQCKRWQGAKCMTIQEDGRLPLQHLSTQMHTINRCAIESLMNINMPYANTSSVCAQAAGYSTASSNCSPSPTMTIYSH